MTTTTQHLGHAAVRARRVAPAAWRPAATGFRGLGTTGVDVSPLPVSAYGISGSTNGTTEPAAVMACIKPFTRHLGVRST